MLVMLHERADIGQSVIAKMQYCQGVDVVLLAIAKCNIVLLHGMLHGTFVDYV